MDPLVILIVAISVSVALLVSVIVHAVTERSKLKAFQKYISQTITEKDIALVKNEIFGIAIPEKFLEPSIKVVEEEVAPVEEVIEEEVAPVEEVIEEEVAPVEEVVEEEVAPVEEVIEEEVAPVEEVVAPVEEVIEEEVAPVEEVIEEEVAPVEEVIEETAEEEVEEVEEEIIVPMLERADSKSRIPFADKMIYLDKKTQGFYNALMNKFKGLRKINIRISSKGVSYRLGRELIAKLTIRGKTLRLHLALDLNAFDEKVYFQKDMGDVRSYVEVPFTVKIRSDRGLRNAMKLIDELIALKGIEEKARFNKTDGVKDLKIIALKNRK